MRGITMKRIAAAAMLAAVAGLSACSKKPPPYNMTDSVKDIMVGLVDPNAVLFWNSSGSNETAEGSQSLTPDTPEKWAAAEHAMTAVAEAGNLLMMPGRARDDGEWVKQAKAMTDLALQAREAARAKNADKMFSTGGALYDACQACHQKYLLPYLDDNGKPKPGSPRAGAPPAKGG